MNDKKKKAEEASEETVEEMTETAPEADENSDSAVETAEISETDKLRNELAAAKDMYLRTVAEYDNFRKRTIKEKSEIYGDATVKAVTEILSVVDNFERALAVETSDENFKKGIQMIFVQYTDILKKLGVKEIEAEGTEFNPEFHHAIQQIEDENLGENTVATVFQKGYMLGDKVIRPAMVVVANP